MKRACVVGWPIAHSRSPIIHGYWLSRYAIDGAYTKEAVPPAAATEFFKLLAQNGFSGCNVTVPHKEIAFEVAQAREASALAVRAANTLWLDAGRLHAANTDTYGYMTYLEQRAPGWRKRDAPVCVLGAGGAARAITYGFLEAGVEEVRVFNRTRERAEDVARHFGRRVKVFEWGERAARCREAGVLVNTTTIGLKGESSLEMDLAGLSPECVVSDIVYVPLETELLGIARRRGLATVDGLGMLLHQAVPGFERWFGVRPEVTEDLYNLIVADIEGHRC